MPRVTLPRAVFRHPEDARAQVRRGIDYFKQIFGFTPTGMWPSEGSVSNEALEIIADSGIGWIATDEDILVRSLDGGLGDHKERLYRPWHFVCRQGEIGAFFRDHQLSDLIGFTYSQWDAGRAVADFCGRLHAIKGRSSGEGKVIPICLDGENAWEYYPNNAYDFLQGLYRGIAESPALNLTLCSDVLARSTFDGRLHGIHPGSWINANYGIWIGHPEENLAWDLLAGARNAAVSHNPAVAEALASGLPAADAGVANDLPLTVRRRRERLVLVVRRRPLFAPQRPLRPTLPPASDERLPAAGDRHTDELLGSRSRRRARPG